MEFTEKHEDLIQETHDAVIKMVDKVDEHHTTLYGNGQPGLVKDHLTFKTRIMTALGILTGIFGIAMTLLRIFK